MSAAIVTVPDGGTLSVVRKVLAEELDIPIEKLQAERPLDELGVDSLGIIEVMFRLEEEFDIRMGDEREPVKTVQDIADIVDARIEARKGTQA